VLEVLHAPRFSARSPAAVVATLLEEGRYLCSPRTMYRILAAKDEVRERRAQLRRPSYAKPELLATGPNQVWTWDLTKLRGPEKWTYFSLYVVLDLFSRLVVAWMLAHRESGELARDLFEKAYDEQGIEPGQLVVHSDRGSAPTAKTLAQLYADLGVEPSLGRPSVSNDNPFSEAHFKTLKYAPGYPDRFGGYEDGLGFCRRFFPWYNHEHRHSALAYLTPAQVHYGQAETTLEKRRRVLEAARARHPERFPLGAPRVARLPAAVWINPPADRSRVELDLAPARKACLPGVTAVRAARGPGSRVAAGDERSELALDAGLRAAHPLNPTQEDRH
jgi:putative transposase